MAFQPVNIPSIKSTENMEKLIHLNKQQQQRNVLQFHHSFDSFYPNSPHLQLSYVSNMANLPSELNPNWNFLPQEHMNSPIAPPSSSSFRFTMNPVFSESTIEEKQPQPQNNARLIKMREPQQQHKKKQATSLEAANTAPISTSVINKEEEDEEEQNKEIEEERASLNETPNKKLKIKKGAELKGEKRLTIRFENFGELGPHIQTFGKNGMLAIPHGLRGSHFMYHETWKFEIEHDFDSYFIDETGNKCLCIIWRIVNVATGEVHEAKETKREASYRMQKGRTISTRLFKEALDRGVSFYQEELSKIDQSKRENEYPVKDLKRKIRHLRPRRFSEGTLAFGLQHEMVQRHLFNTKS